MPPEKTAGRIGDQSPASRATETKQSMDGQREEKRHNGRRVLAILMVLFLVLSMFLTYRAQIRFSGLNYVGQISEYAARVTEDNTGYLSQSTLDRAWTILRTTIRHPRTYEDYNMYSSIAIAREDYTGAAEYLQGCIETFGSEGETTELALLYLRQASLYVLTKDYDTALQKLDRAIELDPTQASAYFLRAEMYMVLGNEEAAVADLNSYKDLDGASPEILSSFGPLYESTGDYESAIECYTAGIVSNQADRANFFFNRARCRMNLGDTAGAGKDLEEYFRLDGEDPNGEAAATLAACRMDESDYSGAIEMFHRAISDGYERPYVLYSQSVLCAYLSGDFPTAIRDGKKAVEGFEAAKENSAELESWIGMACMAQGDYSQATEYFIKASEQDSKLENIFYYLGVSNLAEGETEKAIEYFTMSVEKEESVTASLYNRAVCYLKQGLIESAKDDLGAVTERNDDPELTIQAAELLNQL